MGETSSALLPTLAALTSLVLAPPWAQAAPADHAHRIPGGTCVTFPAPPPAWAYRADGTLRPPSEIHRPKAGGYQVLYLAVDGVTITAGAENAPESSTQIAECAGDYPPFDHASFRSAGLDSRAAVVAALRDWVAFLFAHMMVQVVTERPPAGTEYTMAVLGGSAESCGFPSGVLGVSLLDCYGDPSNVVFVFSDDPYHAGQLERLVLTTVHEAAHSFGAAHVDDADGIMNPMNPGSTEDWGSGPVPDGGQACDGSPDQDTVAVLEEQLGERADSVPPWIEIARPGRSAVMPPSFEARVQGVDDVSLHRITLFVDGGVVGDETLPDFTFPISDLADGSHRMWAIGEDAHGNPASSGAVDFTVSATCSDRGTCDPGPGGVGDPCVNGDDCQSNLCATATEDTAAVCSKRCTEESPCLAGMVCAGVGTGQPGFCVGLPGGAVRLLDAQSRFALEGCSTVPVHDLPFAFGFALALLTYLRRRMS